mgnify:FL=1|jgi:hypothetical protein
MKTEMWGMPSVVDHQNQIVYLKCSSAITAMGIPALVKQYYPGYTGKLVSMEYLEKLRDQFIN